MIEDPDPSCMFVCRQMCTRWHKVHHLVDGGGASAQLSPSPEHVLACRAALHSQLVQAASRVLRWYMLQTRLPALVFIARSHL